MESTTGNWLVKSGGRILGPFSREEVIARLKSKELVLLDEVAQPLHRWRYVRDELVFARVVESLRMGAYAGREDTQPSSMITLSRTDRVTGDSDEFSQTDKLETDPSGKDSELTDRLGDQVDSPESAPASFGYSQDSRVQLRVKRSTKFIWPVTLVVLFALAAFFYSQRRRPISRAEGFDTLMREGIDNKRVANWQAAAEALIRARMIRPDDVGVNLLLAPILIAKQGQTVEGRRMIEKVLPAVFNPMEISQAKTALARADILDGNWDRALKALTQALSAQPDFYPALADMAVLSFLRKDNVTARQYFHSAIEQNPQDNSLSLMLARTRLRAGTQKLNETQLSKIKLTLSQVLNGYDFREEAYLLSAFAEALAGRLPSAKKQVKSLLGFDPAMTDQHVHEILVDRSPVHWKSLAGICSKLVADLGANAEASSLKALCLFKTGHDDQGVKQAINDALKQSPNSRVIRALDAALLFGMGRHAQARAVLTLMGDRAQTSALAQAIAARECERGKRLSCAQEHWKQVLTLRPNSIEAMAGLGRNALTQGHFSRAEKYAAEGLRLSPTYVPLIRLQDSAEARDSR